MSNNFVFSEELEPGILSVIIRNHKKRNALSDSVKLELENIALELRDKTEIKIYYLNLKDQLIRYLLQKDYLPS